jgi:hypothetical protein
MSEQAQTANGRATSEHFIARSRIRATARAEVKQYASDVIEPAVGMALGRLLKEAEARIEARIAALESATKEFRFVGAWQEGMHCRRGNIVTQGGAIFCADRDTSARPGVGSDFVLMIPRPRDGRDGKDFTPAPPASPGGPRMVRSQR